MLDPFLTRALAKSSALRAVVEGELARLAGEGFLSAEDAEALRSEHAERLRELTEGAGEQASALLSGLASGLRQALDLPSRAEVVALTEELRQARQRAEEASGP
ncbi:MAG: hypothetical protein R3F62_20510 [Planctomycetota bacterium]